MRATHITSAHTGVFVIRAGIDKERFEFGLEKIWEEIDRIANGDFTQEEFENALGYTE
ncbi:insulinase family protein [bacterium]|nr:insulinase family protein [bacterium]